MPMEPHTLVNGTLIMRVDKVILDDPFTHPTVAVKQEETKNLEAKKVVKIAFVVNKKSVMIYTLKLNSFFAFLEKHITYPIL